MASPHALLPMRHAENKAPTIIGVFAAMTALSILCAAARIYTRFRLLRTPGMDDLVIVLSVILIVMHLGVSVKATTFGFGKHADDLTSESLLLSIKWVLIGAPVGIIGVAVPKLAVVIFLARVVGPTRHNQIRALYFLTITLIFLTALAAILIFMQCSPPYAPWTPSVPHTCWNPAIIKRFSFFVAAYSAFNDLVLGIFPVSVIFKLQMSRRTQFGISFLMGLGLLACMCAVVRTTKLVPVISHGDWTCKYFCLDLWKETKSAIGGEADLIIWSAYAFVPSLLPFGELFVLILMSYRAEMNVVVICASAPILPPLFQQLTGQKDYLSKRKAIPEQLKKSKTGSSERSIWNDKIMRPIESCGTVDTVAFHNEGREWCMPDDGIRTTTELQTQWETV